MEPVLNLGQGGPEVFQSQADQPVVQRATDPVTLPQPYSSPADFAAQYPTPLDPTEFIAMCEEVGLYQHLDEEMTALKEHTWRELNSLAFTSGSTYISFADGECPEEYTHDGTNTTITLKNAGAKKSLSESDVMHSTAVAAAGWHGINQIVGPYQHSQGLPGAMDSNQFLRETVANVKEKEATIATILVMNGLDRLLVEGNSSSNSLEFDGIETQLTEANGAFYNAAGASGTFSAQTYDQFLAQGCAKPTTLMGHGQAMQQVMSGYFALGFNGSQLVNFETGNRIVPGYNFASVVNTSVGQLRVVSDRNFNLTASGATSFQSSIFSIRERHNGVPLVYRLTQIPLVMKDLLPGCTAISFQVWSKTALIIKHKCAHGRYVSLFSGGTDASCPTIG